MSHQQTQQPVQLQSLKAPAREAGFGSVRGFFNSQKKVLNDVLPQHVDADRILRIALGALRTTPKLMNCSVESLFGAVVQCAQLGLEPNTPLGHAYLIPFENRRNKTTEVQVIFGYKGLIDLARRSGQIVSIAAHVVRKNDHFEFAYGLDEKLEHKPDIESPTSPITAFYAVAKLEGGGHAFEVMSVQQVEAIRNASNNYRFARDKSTTVWGQHFDEMGRKTALRRLFKYLPVSIELATATALDGKAGEEEQNLGAVFDGEFMVEPEGALNSVGEENEEGTDVDKETGEVKEAEQERLESLEAVQEKKHDTPKQQTYNFDME